MPKIEDLRSKNLLGVVGESMLVWPQQDSVRFRHQDVELLLDQAADYLDRVLRDRTTLRQLQREAFETAQYGTQHKYENMLAVLKEKDFHHTKFDLDRELHGYDLQNQDLWHVEQLYDQAKTTIAENSTDSELQRVRKGNEAEQFSTRATRQVIGFRAEAAQSRLTAYNGLGDLGLLVNTNLIWNEREQEANREGGALNFGEQIRPLQKCIENDFYEAKRRILSAHHGLSRFYNYDTQLPDPTTEGSAFIDACVIWVRQAISYVVGITSSEESMLMVYSIRNLVGDRQWELDASNSEWSFNLLPKWDKFQRYHLPRIRGIGLAVLPMAPFDIWSMQVSIDGRVAYAGRVFPVAKDRDPDVIGRGPFRNLNPFVNEEGQPATWTIEPFQSVSGRHHTDNLPDSGSLSIDDIWLLLHLVISRAEV